MKKLDNMFFSIKNQKYIFISLYLLSIIFVGSVLIFFQNTTLVSNITFLQIISAFFSLALMTFLPGIALQEIFFKTNPIKKFGLIGFLLFSFFFGSFVNMTSLIISYASRYAIQGSYNFESSTFIVYLINIFIFCCYCLIIRRSKLLGEINLNFDKFLIGLFSLFIIIAAFEIVIVSLNWPLIWGDQWRWIGEATQITTNNIDFSTFTSLYFYSFFLALFFSFTHAPFINSYILFGVLSSIFVTSAIYLLGKVLFNSREKSTIFVWVCFLSLPVILPFSLNISKYGILQLASTVWNLESDVTLLPNIFAPQFQFGLPALFFLISILFYEKTKNLQSIIVVFIISYVAYASHIAEIFLFELFLVIFLLLKDDESNPSWFLISTGLGIFAFLSIDYLMPFRWYSEYESGILSVIAVIMPILVFIILQIFPKLNLIKFLKKTLNSPKIIIASFLIALTFIIVGTALFLSIQYKNPLLSIYQIMGNSDQIPWFIWATRIILTLPITFLLYLICLKIPHGQLNLGSIASKFLTFIIFFIVTIVLLRISNLVGYVWYVEYRLEIYLMVAMAIPTTLLIIIVKRYDLKENKRLKIIALVLLSIFALNGLAGIAIYSGFWANYGVQIPVNYVDGASEAQRISLQGGNILTYSDYPSQQLLYLVGTSKLKHIIPTEAFFLLQKESSFMELANSYNLSTIFLTNYDRELISSQTNDSYIVNSLPHLPLYYSNDGTTVNGIPTTEESNFSSLPKFTDLCISSINFTSSSTINLTLPRGSVLYISNESFTLNNHNQYENFDNSSLIISSNDSETQLFFNSNTMEIYGPLETGNILLKITNASSISFSAPYPIIEIIQNNVTSRVNAQEISFNKASLFTINASSLKVSVNGSEQFNELYYVSEVSRNRGLVWSPDIDFSHCDFEGVFESQFIFLDSNISSVVFSGSFNINQ